MHHKCGDCSWFRDGYCRKLRQPAGFFTIACDDFALGTADTAPATKVCKTCGRELTLDHFGGHHRTADHLQASCKECMNAKIKKAAQASWDKRKGNTQEQEEEPAQIVKSEGILQVMGLESYTDDEIADELARRGWSGNLYKATTLTIKCPEKDGVR